MRIMLITDAWEPQVNGVVRTLKRVIEECEAMGHEWGIVSPQDGFWTMPLPTYPEIKLAINARRKVTARFEEFPARRRPTLPLKGHSAWPRGPCVSGSNTRSRPHNHTRFPEYVAARFPVPLSWGYSFVHWFHKYSGKVMVATPSMREELQAHDFINVVACWTRGVDTELFNPAKRIEAGAPGDPFEGLPRPVYLNVGRVAVEKNIEAFAPDGCGRLESHYWRGPTGLWS